MPTVARGPAGIRIEQRYKEHHPPHFHAIQGNDAVSIRIADLGVEAGSLPNVHLGAVMAWASNHRRDLALNWVLALAQMPLDFIAWP